MRHSLVKDVMTAQVVSIGPHEGYREIAGLLVEHMISAVPVVDESRRVLGVVSEADLMAKVELGIAWPAAAELSRRRRRTRVKAAGDVAADLMTAPAVTISGNASLAAAARVMADERVRRLPVVDADGRLIGIVSRRDLLQVQLRDPGKVRAAVAEMLWEWFQVETPQVDVEVHDGIVTLSGEIERKKQSRLAGELARAVEGVVDVDNRLTYRIDDGHTIHRS